MCFLLVQVAEVGAISEDDIDMHCNDTEGYGWDFKRSGWDENANVLSRITREQSSVDATQLLCCGLLLFL